MIKIDSDIQINEILKEKDTIFLLKFGATWCGPCRMLAPILEKLESKVTDGVKILDIDIDNNTVTRINYKVMSVPTVILVKDNVEQTRFVGVQAISIYEQAIAAIA